VASQGRRLEKLVPRARTDKSAARETSAALRFLLEHGARAQVAAAIPATLPEVRWDSVATNRVQRDSVARSILSAANIPYVPEYDGTREGYVYFNAEHRVPVAISDYDWLLDVAGSSSPVRVGAETVGVGFDTATGVARASIDGDTLAFDLRRLAQTLAADQTLAPNSVPAERLSVEASGKRHRARLAIQHLNGRKQGDSVQVQSWSGQLLVGRR
jgi:hypothetical protein